MCYLEIVAQEAQPAMPLSGGGDDFYRAMHYSAKRGIAIAWRLSVTLVDQNHIADALFLCGS